MQDIHMVDDLRYVFTSSQVLLLQTNRRKEELLPGRFGQIIWQLCNHLLPLRTYFLLHQGTRHPTCEEGCSFDGSLITVSG